MTIQIDITKIASVYSGRDGKCCCGCAGKHYRTSTTPTPDHIPVSDTQVRRVVSLIQAEADVGNATDEGFAYIAVVGRRLYMATKAEVK